MTSRNVSPSIRNIPSIVREESTGHEVEVGGLEPAIGDDNRINASVNSLENISPAPQIPFIITREDTTECEVAVGTPEPVISKDNEYIASVNSSRIASEGAVDASTEAINNTAPQQATPNTSFTENASLQQFQNRSPRQPNHQPDNSDLTSIQPLSSEGGNGVAGPEPTNQSPRVRDVTPSNTSTVPTTQNQAFIGFKVPVDQTTHKIPQQELFSLIKFLLSESDIPPGGLKDYLLDTAAALPSPKTDKPEGPVAYKVRWKNSKLDASWQHRNMTEDGYERQKSEHSDAVIEMLKDAQLAHPAEAGKELRIATLQEERMIIHSESLIRIMSEVVGYYPVVKTLGDTLDGHRKLIISKPYRMLGGALPKLQQTREAYQKEIAENVSADPKVQAELKEKKITMEHIEYLEHELNKVLKAPIDQERRGYLATPKVASFHMLWLLFRPGTIVYTLIDDTPVCCMVKFCFWGGIAEPDNGRKVTLSIKLFFLDFNGTRVDRRSHCVRVDSFEGKRNILDLEAYPLQYLEDTTMRQKLIDRGKKYMELLKKTAPQCTYHGFVFAEQTADMEMRGRHHYVGKAVVDPVFHYIEVGPPFKAKLWPEASWLDKSDTWPSETSDGSMAKFVDIDPKDKKRVLGDEHYLLLTCWIRGFALGTRKWGWLHLDHIRELDMQNYQCFLEAYSSPIDKPDVKLIENLIIEEPRLRMVKSFVPKLEAHRRGDNPQVQSISIDPVRGKGEGYVMLLHGPPGTGKTFTVECLAEYSGRPLIRVSCGELGLDATRLEAILFRWFRMAEEWQAILLLDEADVYLQQRGSAKSFVQDNMVAVFLRALEYYRGILFLTSNCVLFFDDAVISRTSLVVEFKKLDHGQRRTLIDRYITKIEKDPKRRYEITPTSKTELSRLARNDHYTYNGREIMIVFRTAVALATQDAKEASENLRLEEDDHYGNISSGPGTAETEQKHCSIVLMPIHFQTVMKSMEDFADYQKGSKEGKSTEDMAADDNRRRSAAVYE